MPLNAAQRTKVQMAVDRALVDQAIHKLGNIAVLMARVLICLIRSRHDQHDQKNKKQSHMS